MGAHPFPDMTPCNATEIHSSLRYDYEKEFNFVSGLSADFVLRARGLF